MNQAFILLLLNSMFISTLASLNIVGLTKFIDLSFYIGQMPVPMIISSGGIIYPLTFLLSHITYELYGNENSSNVIKVGFIVNLWLLLVLILINQLPSYDAQSLFCKQEFSIIEHLAFSGILSSMFAYLISQFFNLACFKFIKKLFKNHNLTLTSMIASSLSQILDGIVMMLTLYIMNALPINDQSTVVYQLFILILSSLAYKLIWSFLGGFLVQATVRSLRRLSS